MAWTSNRAWFTFFSSCKAACMASKPVPHSSRSGFCQRKITWLWRNFRKIGLWPGQLFKNGRPKPFRAMSHSPRKICLKPPSFSIPSTINDVLPSHRPVRFVRRGHSDIWSAFRRAPSPRPSSSWRISRIPWAPDRRGRNSRTCWSRHTTRTTPGQKKRKTRRLRRRRRNVSVSQQSRL